MKKLVRCSLLLVASLALLADVGESRAAPGPMLAALARSPLARPGSPIIYDVRVSGTDSPSGQSLALSATLPVGSTYLAGSTLVNGRSAADPLVSGSTARWTGLSAPANQQNRFGIHTFVQDVMDAPHTATQLDWSRALSGPGGYVKQLIYPIAAATPGAQQSWIDFVAAAYARDLTPVLRLQGSYNPRAARWEKPQADPDGSYASIAAAFRRVVAQLPRREGYRLYLEIWNEPNLDVEWGGLVNPTEYARFLVAVSQALKSLGDPSIVIMNAGLAPGGNYPHLDFMDAMFQAVPAAATSFDVWASHPYAGNHPPSFNENYYSIRGYQWELARLARYRSTANLKVLATEAGYALGNRDDPRFPPIDENNRAAYTREAFESYWSKDDALLAVAPFELADPFSGWSAFDWVYPSSGTGSDGSPTLTHPVYEAVKSVPRSAMEVAVTFQLGAPSAEGIFQPSFQASSGTTVVEAKGEAVVITNLAQAGVISGQVAVQGRTAAGGITVSAGSFNAKTAPDGSFHLAVPPGSYAVSVAAPSYLAGRRDQVPVAPNARTTLPGITLLSGNVVREPAGSGQPERVDLLDLAAIAAVYNSTPPGNPAADLNGDGTVNVFDLVAATSNLGRAEPSPWP